MNSLSWMIYIASVADGVRIIFFICCAISTMTSLIFLMIGATPLNERERQMFKHLKMTVPAAALFALLGVVTPCSNAIYAIAASEFGEEALKTPEATKARAALNAWLDKQIEPEKSK